MNPQEINSLQTYTEQRDTLLKDVADAQKLNDSLQTENRNLSASNSGLVNEIISNKKEITLLQERLASDIIATDRTRVSLGDEISSLTAQRDDLIKQVELLISLFNNTNKSFTTAQETAQTVTSSLNEIEATVKGHVETISESVTSIKSTSDEIKSTLTDVIDKGVSLVEKYEAKNASLGHREAEFQSKERVMVNFIRKQEGLAQ